MLLCWCVAKSARAQNFRVLAESCYTACDMDGMLSRSLSLRGNYVLSYGAALPANTERSVPMFVLHFPDSVQGSHTAPLFILPEATEINDMTPTGQGENEAFYCGKKYISYTAGQEEWHGVVGQIRVNTAMGTMDTVWSVEDSAVTTFSKVIVDASAVERTLYAIGERERKNAGSDYYIYKIQWGDGDTVDMTRMRVPSGEMPWTLECGGGRVFVTGTSHVNNFCVRRVDHSVNANADSLDVRYDYALPDGEMLSGLRTVLTQEGVLAVGYVSTGVTSEFDYTVRFYNAVNMGMESGQSFYNPYKTDMIGIAEIDGCGMLSVMTWGDLTGEEESSTITMLNGAMPSNYIAESYMPHNHYYHLTKWNENHLLATGNGAVSMRWYVKGCEDVENSSCYNNMGVYVNQLDVYPYVRSSQPMVRAAVRKAKRAQVPAVGSVNVEPQCTEYDAGGGGGDEPVVH